jgi:transporter family protein
VNGLVLILAAAVLWGIGSFFSKLAVTTIEPWTAALVRSVVFFPIVGGYVASQTRLTWPSGTSAGYALAAGVLTGVTVLTTRLALTVYDVSVVSPIKRLSLLVTVSLSVVVFSETLTRRKVGGIFAALAALVFLS